MATPLVRRRKAALAGRPFVLPETANLKSRWLSTAGLWQDSALTIPASANNDPLGGWVDQFAATPISALQATAGNRPTWETNVFNGKPGVHFASASSHFMSADALAAAFTGTDLPFTFLVAFKLAANGVATAPLSLGSSAAVNPYCLCNITATNTPQINRRNDTAGSNLTANGTAQANTNTHLAAFWFDGTNAKIFWDGRQTGSTTAINVGATTFNRFTLGCWRRNEAGVGINPFNGWIAELAAYNVALSDTSLAAWANYSTTYGVAL